VRYKVKRKAAKAAKKFCIAYSIDKEKLGNRRR
jgi:hypothetical protein